MKNIKKFIGTLSLVGMFALGVSACKQEVPQENANITEDVKEDSAPIKTYFNVNFVSIYDEKWNVKEVSPSFGLVVWDYGANPGIKSMKLYEDNQVLKDIKDAHVGEQESPYIAYHNDEEQWGGYDTKTSFIRSIWIDEPRTGVHTYYMEVVDNGDHLVKTSEETVDYDAFMADLEVLRENNNQD